MNVVTIWLEPFLLLLAILPLAAYFLLLGCMRLWFGPLVTTGGRDFAALALALSGVIAVGPLELFFPAAAATRLGPYVWIFLLLFYVLSVWLTVLSMQPRLVIYGATAKEVCGPLLLAARHLDESASWDASGRQVWLPNRKIRLRIDGHSQLDPAQVSAFEPNIEPMFWHLLLGYLRAEMKGVRVRPKLPQPARFSGALMLVTGSVLMVTVVTIISVWPLETAVGFRDWFSR